MQIDTFVLGDFETNCYVLRSSSQAKRCLIIDPGFSAEELVEFLKKESLQPNRIILTHGHCDHIGGIELLQKNYESIPISISKEDSKMLTASEHNLSVMIGSPFKLTQSSEQFEDGDIIEVDQIKLQVLATPGHTPGSVSFYCKEEDVVFTGDSLFSGSIGRCDFPGGDIKILIQSIREKLLTLPNLLAISIA